MSGSERYFENLNNEDAGTRLESLRMLAAGIAAGDKPNPVKLGYGNNHIHTFYSFSPYSPSAAVWLAYNAGLATAGIVDHDSVGGAMEFLEAGRILGIATTIGAECRADFSNTRLSGRRINNPDQASLAYMAIHGIPHTKIDSVRDFFAPYTAERNKRNAAMILRLNAFTEPFDIRLDFDRDVKPLSKSDEGGSITERHILFALSQTLIQKFGKGLPLISFLRQCLKMDWNASYEQKLSDRDNPFYEYVLLGILKSSLMERFYIDAGSECPNVREVLAFCEETGSIAAYAYLGDVTASVTGDKKPQYFEDGYLDELFETIAELGFRAVTYMPSRNTPAQLKRVKDLCEKYGMFQISGEDINSPGQAFVCEAMSRPECRNLVDAAWALIGHERAATRDIKAGMFSEETRRRCPDLLQRIAVYKEFGEKGGAAPW